jgi:hypothetical protein
MGSQGAFSEQKLGKPGLCSTCCAGIPAKNAITSSGKYKKTSIFKNPNTLQDSIPYLLPSKRLDMTTTCRF